MLIYKPFSLHINNVTLWCYEREIIEHHKFLILISIYSFIQFIVVGSYDPTFYSAILLTWLQIYIG